jgi:hypothetical protein
MLEEFLIGWAINTILTVLRMVVKNPEKKKALESAMRKVYESIGTVYGFTQP